MGDNREQIEYWNGPVGERWVKHQADFDRAIGVFGDAALAELPLAPGARVLDVGCGAGASTLHLMERVAPGGSVVGVDVSRPLLERAQARLEPRARELGVALELVLADAATFCPAAPFDALFSRFGVMFFSEPTPAFASLRRALVAGAPLAFVCWRPLADNPWCAVPLAAARHIVPAPPQGADPRAPGPFAFSEPDYVRGILTSAGFCDVRVTPFDALAVLSDSGLSDAVEQALRLGPTGRVVADQPADMIARVREAIAQALAPFVQGDDVRLPGGTWVVSARAA